MSVDELVEEVRALVVAMGRGEGEETLLLALCKSAVDEMLARLRTSVRVEDCLQAFVLACAWIVVEGLAATGSSTASSFRVGEVSVTSSESESGGSDLRTRAEGLMRPYVKATQFAFVSVEG